LGWEKDHPYLVMEYIAGDTLEKFLEAPCEQSLALSIVHELLKGLSYIHQRQLIHRDLKPANIMISVDGQVKILDFGLVKPGEADATVLTKVDTVLGTLAYMAPEQFFKPDAVDQRADLYALGIILYQLLSQSFPFSKEGESGLKQKWKEGPRPLSDLLPDVDSRVERLVLRLLSPDPSQRFQTADAVSIELEKITNYSDLKIEPGTVVEKKMTGLKVFEADYFTQETKLGAFQSATAQQHITGLSSDGGLSGSTQFTRQASQKKWWAIVSAACILVAALFWWQFSFHTHSEATHRGKSLNAPQDPTLKNLSKPVSHKTSEVNSRLVEASSLEPTETHLELAPTLSPKTDIAPPKAIRKGPVKKPKTKQLSGSASNKSRDAKPPKSPLKKPLIVPDTTNPLTFQSP
jgi:serine/threonine protein kinase